MLLTWTSSRIFNLKVLFWILLFVASLRNTKPYIISWFYHPEALMLRQHKSLVKQFDNSNSRWPTYKSGGEVDPYSPDIAPMNIFENQVIPTGMHNLSKMFRPNLATIRVLSLGMKFIPQSDTLKWKNVFSNFERFRQRISNKMFFFVEILQELSFYGGI